MTAPRDMLSRWAPLILVLVSNAVLFGIFYGRTQSEVSALRTELMPMEKRMEVFVTRREYEALRDIIRDTNKKVDAIYQRQFSKDK